MTDLELHQSLKKIVEDSLPFRDLLLQYKNAGGSSDGALAVATALRNDYIAQANEALEDRVLEVMDVIVGWCSAGNRVWE